LAIRHGKYNVQFVPYVQVLVCINTTAAVDLAPTPYIEECSNCHWMMGVGIFQKPVVVLKVTKCNSKDTGRCSFHSWNVDSGHKNALSYSPHVARRAIRSKSQLIVTAAAVAVAVAALSMSG
jgi:hypothetical protein